MIGIEDLSTHMTRRRAWNRGFSSAAIAEYEELVGRRAMQLVQRLEERQGKQVDIERWFDYFSSVCSESLGGVQLTVTSKVRRDVRYDVCLYHRPSLSGSSMTRLYRFGGGPELLRDGDENNVWSVLSAGMT